jgi:GT2 family glycosyltransferase
MAVSVIISNLNGARFLPRLLETLEAQRGVELEIIVVDRQSTDASAEILAQHPQVIVVSEPPLTGLVSGYHRGTLAATKEHFFFINEDMWFDLDCLARLERQIDLSRRIGAADPWQWTYDEANWIHGVTRFVPVRWAINGVHPFRASDFNVDLPAGSIVPFACAGACLIHRQVYEEVGGWDTSMFLDYEDIDFFLRAWQRGWRCVAVPDAKVYHAVGMSNPGASLNAPQKAGAGQRRYIANCYGKTLIAWKLFSAPNALWIGSAIWLVMFANNTLKLRWRIASWDLAALRKCLSRLPEILAFRRANREFTRRHPGEQFFLQPEFARSPKPVDAPDEERAT